MALTLRLGLLALVGATLVACESSDLERATLGGVGGALAAEALGGDAVTGAALGVAAGTVCDDLTPQLCG